MRPINLIPAEDRRGERAPLRAGPLSYVLVGVLLLAFAGVYFLVSIGNTVSEREAELVGLEQQLQSSQARAAALQSFSDFASLEQARTETVSGLARTRFDWERVMRELSLVIPADISLTSVVGSVSPESGAGSGDSDSGSDSAGGIQAPTLTMNGCGTDHEAIARFVAALRDIDGVTRVGLESSAEAETEDAVGGAAPSAGGTSGGECFEAASFEVTIAFDGVQVDPAGGGIVPEAPLPQPGDGSGVAEAQAEKAAGAESVDSAKKKTNETVDTFVPGA